MNGTPRLRSAFPSTPRKSSNGPAVQSEQHTKPRNSDLPTGVTTDRQPLIPSEILDPPTQRLYVVTFYLALVAWKSFDYLSLVTNEVDSLWFFMKWSAIDGLFLFGLPGLRVPWLEWSPSASTILFLAHAILDAILMFRIPMPFGTWALAATKVFWDRELAVSERRVKPASILQNSSLILGKQIVHILPEGFAILNPEESSYCIGGAIIDVELPIHVNQTTLSSIELLHYDLESNVYQPIVISKKEIRKMKKLSAKSNGQKSSTGPGILQYTARKPGLYKLQKALDESSLEVQKSSSDTLVVQCPWASAEVKEEHRCKGALSDFAFSIHGTPPLKIRVSKTVNKELQGTSILSIQPDTRFALDQHEASNVVTLSNPSTSIDLTWARVHHLSLPINETLGSGGYWIYTVDEIQDSLGNTVNYSFSDKTNSKPRQGLRAAQKFEVHERPKALLDGCSPQHPIRAPAGKYENLPIKIMTGTSLPEKSQKHSVNYVYTAQEHLTPDGEHNRDAIVHSILMKSGQKGPLMVSPGLYSITSISTDYCLGEILEPASCLFLNPPIPQLTLSAENITDSCAGRSVGLTVDLEMVGTPPLEVVYTVRRDGGKSETVKEEFDRLRAQLTFLPETAGSYTYEFLKIQDRVYDYQLLKPPAPQLHQNVRPRAYARFRDIYPRRKACIEESASFELRLSGEAPWALEYELVHGARKVPHIVKDINEEYFTLRTEKLLEGGEYSLSLKGITDSAGCKVFLDDEAKIDVRRQRPKAAFAEIEGRRSLHTLQGKKVRLPLRLSGEGPWKVTYRAISGTELIASVDKNNDHLEVFSENTFELLHVEDQSCPGTIEEHASRFEVQWIRRPALQIVDSATIEQRGLLYVKSPVCEGEPDAVDLRLVGTPPYRLKYDNKFPDRGSNYQNIKELVASAGVTSVRLDTSHAGTHEYRFSSLADNLYDHDHRYFKGVMIKQTVFQRPNAKFENAGKSYSYCKEGEGGEEVIPITFSGKAPFAIEIAIRHHATTNPEILRLSDIPSNRYLFHIPHGTLGIGTHSVSIRKVRDGNDCRSENELVAAFSSIFVNVAQLPSISPLESRSDYCVGDRISYTLSGTPPFTVSYTFRDIGRKALSHNTHFQRLAETPGDFVITGLNDKASSDNCVANVNIKKTIHELPSVRISKGKVKEVDIHEGGVVEILFEFTGSSPFEFTYTRSTNATPGKKSIVIETRYETSNEHTKTVRVSDEGTYEVVSIRDRYCGFSSQAAQGRSGQKLLT
ncbi:hypothetical protein MMC25_004697 [Agyrium rufum]|nr:hypothetical protein [Agyrium rufum]